MNPVIRSFEAKIDDFNESERSITAKISTSAVDRYNTCFDLRGCDLKAYNQNRICLWEHGRCPQRGSLPIGKNLWIRVDKSGAQSKMIAKTQFKDDEFSSQLYRDYQQAFLNAWSISVLPTDFGPPRADEIRARPELKNVETIYRQFEMCEYSAVAVPGNFECTSIPEENARALNRLIVRGFWSPPSEIKEHLDRAMTEGELATGGALVKPDTVDDACAPPADKPKKRKKPKSDDDADDDDDDDDSVDEGINVAGGGMMAVGASADDAETVTRDAPEPVVEPEPTPEPVIELPPLTGRTFQEIVAAHILEERHFRHEMKRKFEEHREWLQGIA